MNYLKELVETARTTIESGYYRPTGLIKNAPSLVKVIEQHTLDGDVALIAEIKPATPSKGKLVEGGYAELMKRFLDEGACGLSVLTEPRHFNGSLANLKLAVKTGAPTLMKDFILSEEQIDCAAHLGASAVLLIANILPKSRIQTLIEYAHLAEREVLLECVTPQEYVAAMESDADLVGINNRDLRTFQVDLNRTLEIAKVHEKEKPLVSLSGFASHADVKKVADVADAVLVGSSLLEGKTTVKELLGT